MQSNCTISVMPQAFVVAKITTDKIKVKKTSFTKAKNS